MIAMNRYKWLCIKVGVRHGHAKGGDPWIPLLAQTRMPCTPHRIDRTCDPQQSVYHAQTQLLLSSPRCQPVDQSVHVGSAHTSDLWSCSRRLADRALPLGLLQFWHKHVYPYILLKQDTHQKHTPLYSHSSCRRMRRSCTWNRYHLPYQVFAGPHSKLKAQPIAD